MYYEVLLSGFTFWGFRVPIGGSETVYSLFVCPPGPDNKRRRQKNGKSMDTKWDETWKTRFHVRLSKLCFSWVTEILGAVFG